MKKYILELAVFVCGAVVMIFELAGSRILAPHMGTSLVIWTSIIGIVLGSLSLGYYLGGRLADIKPNYRQFSFIILTAAVFILFAGVTKDVIVKTVLAGFKDLRLSGALASILLFSPASVCLGMVTPYALRLKIKDIKKTGTISGGLYAISTIGSIVGTFAAGFLLIPFFGANKIVFITSAIMALLALLIYFQNFKKNIMYFLVIFLALSLLAIEHTSAKNQLVDVDTYYNRILVKEFYKQDSGRKVRYVATDPHAMQGAIYVDDPSEPVFDYIGFFDLAEYFHKDIKNTLLIGGGIYTYPPYFLRRHNEAKMDVVEIDSKFLELAKDYFYYQEDERIKIFHEDGRTFLNNVQEKYDCIFMDAFGSKLSIPFQLTTREAITKMYNALNDNGLAVVNIISAIEGKKSKFLQAEYATYKSVFPQVLIFPVRQPADGAQSQNMVLIAFKGEEPPILDFEDPVFGERLKHLWTKEIGAEFPILTDDYAPVDFYVLDLML